LEGKIEVSTEWHRGIDKKVHLGTQSEFKPMLGNSPKKKRKRCLITHPKKEKWKKTEKRKGEMENDSNIVSIAFDSSIGAVW